jgi:hypothetical protein
VAKVGTSKAGGTISQQAAVHPWLAADAHVNKQTAQKNMRCDTKADNCTYTSLSGSRKNEVSNPSLRSVFPCILYMITIISKKPTSCNKVTLLMFI